jgi:hypothetical protein
MIWGYKEGITCWEIRGMVRRRAKIEIVSLIEGTRKVLYGLCLPIWPIILIGNQRLIRLCIEA